jgi:hypothetical protein
MRNSTEKVAQIAVFFSLNCLIPDSSNLRFNISTLINQFGGGEHNGTRRQQKEKRQ